MTSTPLVNPWNDREASPPHEATVLLVLTVMIGAVIGLVVVAFIVVTENLGARMYPAGAHAWRRFLIPTAGSLGAGFLLWRYFSDARGSGIPQTKAALFLNDGIIRFRTALGKFICCSLTLASGVALGREGPSVQIGAGIGSTLGRRLGLSPKSIRALVPISAAAALAAAFNTPIAAVFFTLEEVMGDLHAPVLGSIALSSATSWTVLHLLLGDEPLFHVPAYELVHPVEFLFYAMLGVAGGFVSVAFVKLLLWQRTLFQRMPSRTIGIQPVVGGLLVGALGLVVPEVLGVGYGYVGKALNGELLITTMALLVVLKVVATATCYASGNSGGIFGPTLFIGGMLGGAFGGLVHLLLPDYTGSIGAYALVGMGAAFAGVVRVPLTSVIMIFEVTRDYSIVVPLMISNLTAYFISSRYQHEPIYEALQHQDGIYLPGGARDREQQLVVGQGCRPPDVVLSEGETIDSVLDGIHADEGAWAVVNERGLLGMVTFAKLREAFMNGHGHEPVASLVAPLDVLSHSLFADDTLDTAMMRMAETGMKVLPVVSRSDLRKLTAVVTLHDILTTYGLGEGERQPKAEPEPVSQEAVTSLKRIAMALTLAIFLSGFLAYYYRTERRSHAQREFEEGSQLASAGHFEEAIGKFRSAIATSHKDEHRLALANALLNAGHLTEAQSAFQAVLRQHPSDGPANLGAARLAVKSARQQVAVADYHRAIYGQWPGNASQQRAAARQELIRVLNHLGQGEQARAEMAAWRNESPNDPQPYAELAEGDLSSGDFSDARNEFRDAAQRAPSNAYYNSRVEMLDEILSMDPAMTHLRAESRVKASAKLLRVNMDSLNRCVGRKGGTDAARDLLKQARARLQGRGAREESEPNASLAVQLWNTRAQICGTPGPDEEALSRLMTQLAK